MWAPAYPYLSTRATEAAKEAVDHLEAAQDQLQSGSTQEDCKQGHIELHNTLWLKASIPAVWVFQVSPIAVEQTGEGKAQGKNHGQIHWNFFEVTMITHSRIKSRIISNIDKLNVTLIHVMQCNRMYHYSMSCNTMQYKQIKTSCLEAFGLDSASSWHFFLIFI